MIRPTAALAALLLLGACSREVEEPVDPVPQPTAASANRLMSQAEDAAGNAAARMDALKVTNTVEERP